jgi:hypothetical protein
LAGLYAVRVVSFERPEGPPNLVIEIAVNEGGPRRRITCRSTSPTERSCGLDGVNATFAIPESKLAPLLPAPPHDAGIEAGAPAPVDP